MEYVPYNEIAGKKYITVDGVRMLRRALGMPDILTPAAFMGPELGGLRAWQLYLKGVREETFKACHPSMWDEFERAES